MFKISSLYGLIMITFFICVHGVNSLNNKTGDGVNTLKSNSEILVAEQTVLAGSEAGCGIRSGLGSRIVRW